MFTEEGFPSDRMFRAEEGPIALLMGPKLCTPLIGPYAPHTVQFLVELRGS